ncbi:MAG: TonB-dependent receptor, partial [Flavobacteriaceae bacterium]|nr:TonB-dependent receptor [Flavobacteriaceae bacterium]
HFENQASIEGTTLNTTAQSDLQNPNRIVQTGERYNYNYEIDASVTDAFVQAQFDYNIVNFYLAASFGTTKYQRNGIYENGYYPGINSLGKSEKVNFTSYAFKGGMTYKFTGQHLVNFNGSYLIKAPTIRNSFENPRQNNRIVSGLTNESAFSIDVSYTVRTPIIKAKITGYHTSFSDGTEIGFFFTESGATFVQEIITNIQRRNIGGELGIEAKITPTITLKGVASVGQFLYNNNPNVYYSSSDFEIPITYGNGASQLKNVHVSGGPERAFQFGFEYRDPDYWWFGATINHFSRAFVDASVLKRSDAFAMDFDLIPDDVLSQGGNIRGYRYNDYDNRVAKSLLKQEQFDSYALINVIGGKSWKVGDYYIGCFATINNVLNQQYKTGGFEQSRRIGYRAQIKEQRQDNGPLFGNRYFFGNGTTYYINFYLRF